MAETATETETAETPATEPKLTAREKKVAEIRDIIARVPSVVIEGDEEKVQTLREEALTLVQQLRGKDVAAEKAKLRNEFDRAVEKAKKKAPKAVIVTKETPDYTKIPGMVEGRDKIAQSMLEGIAAQAKVADIALTIARADIEQAVQITDKNGDPDWDRKTHENKRRKTDVMAKLGEAVGASGMNVNEAAEYLTKLDTSITNARRTANILYVRSLDERPEEAARWTKALEAHPDKQPSEAVFTYTGMPQLTRAEDKAKKDAEKKGESDDENEKGESTPRFFTNLKAMKEAADKAKDNIKNLKDDESRAKARAELRDLLDELAELRGQV